MSKFGTGVSLALSLVLGGSISGCTASSNEIRYFATVDNTGVPVNYFRMTVTPGTMFTNTRYMSGYYDERAVDLFLNENKVSTDPHGSIKPIFPTDVCADTDDAAACKTKMDNRLRMVPLGGANPAGNDAFIMILSSNAAAVSETIGSFAGNETVMNNLLFLTNHDKLTQAAEAVATAPLVTADRTATYALIDAALTSAAAIDGATATARATREQSYVLILQTAAREIGANAAFTTIEGARASFEGAPK